MSEEDNSPVKTFTIPMPVIDFVNDEERLSFQVAVQSAANVMESVTNPGEYKDELISIGDAILTANGFDPIAWSEKLWGAVTAARVQRLAITSASAGNA